MSFLDGENDKFSRNRIEECPKCGCRNSQEIRSVFKSDFSNLDKVLDGSFFDFPCEVCGTIIHHVYPFLYVNYNKYVTIQFRPPYTTDSNAYYKKVLEHTENIRKKLLEQTKSTNRKIPKTKQVTTLYDLKEAIFLGEDSKINAKYLKNIKSDIAYQSGLVKRNVFSSNLYFIGRDLDQLKLQTNTDNEVISIPITLFKQYQDKYITKKNKRVNTITKAYQVLVSVVVIAFIVLVILKKIMNI